MAPHAHVPVTLQWQDINLRVTLGKGKAATEKSILTNVSAYAAPGELLAIMGPSGAGKTSLLNCLAMRNRDFQGALTINGNAWTSDFARSTAYMHQTEHFLNELTPREHLGFQAQLRMPASTAALDGEAAVNRVIAELGLEKCQHTPIGNPLAEGGLSRNERKRLNFASEVLTDPTLLFVDEPTTGLDSFMAENVVKQLKKLASGGQSGTKRTIICTIHQPSSDVFKVFDKLLLLADGRVAYFGPVSAVSDYFAALQHPAPPHTNPADHIMRVLVDPTKPEQAQATRNAICDHAAALAPQKPNTLVAAESADPLELHRVGGFLDETPSWCAQFAALARREIQTKLRSKVAFHANLARTIVLSMIFGLTFLRTELTQKGIFPLNGVIFFITAMSIIQGALAQVMTLPAKMPAIVREQQSGAFSISAFYFAKTASDLPFDVFFTLIWSAITYWMINLGDDVTNFIVFFALQLLCAQVACGIGYLAGFLFDNPAVAFLFCIINTIPAMLFGGFMININSVPPGFRWLRDVSSIKYGYSLVMINFWDGPASGALPCTAEDLVELGFCPYPTGQDVLVYSGIDASMWWRDLIALSGIATFYRVMALWAITKRARPRAFEGAAPDDGTAVLDANSVADNDNDNTATGGRDRVPITLQWDNLCLQVTDADGGEKTILSKATGIARPGRVLVIMGPSGAGKTAYLNSLAGKQSATGELTLNGDPFKAEHTRFGGFMFQEEMFQEGLSVREHLRFQAALRMPASVSASQRLARVETTIAELGLTTCSDTLIGKIGGGISGGERKRLSFASEVLMDPSILFVDEPTSGLDSAMAENVMHYLQKLARDRVPRTVIATIHQPSRALYDLFDDLCLLHDGRTAFFGRAADAPLEHFARQGYECPMDCNPPDHFMRLLGTEGGTADEGVKAANRARTAQLCDAWDETGVLLSVEEGSPSGGAGAQGGDGPILRSDSNYDASFCVQFTSLLKRELTTRKRSKLMFKAVVGRTIFMTLLVGLIWFQNLGTGNDQEGVQSIFGCLQMIAINAYMTSGFGLTQELPAQLAPTLREHKAGMYSIGSWFASRTLSDMPFETVFPLISAAGYWLLVGFRPEFARSVNFALLMIATSWNANAFGIFAGALGGTADSAFGIFGAFVFPCIIFSGFLITGDAIPVFFRWIEWISPFKYIFTLMNINQWDGYGALGECFCADGSIPTACSDAVEAVDDCVPHTVRVCPADTDGRTTSPRCAFPDGESVLNYFSISTSDTTLWIILLIINTVAWRALAYVALRWRARSTVTVKQASTTRSQP